MVAVPREHVFTERLGAEIKRTTFGTFETRSRLQNFGTGAQTGKGIGGRGLHSSSC